MSKIKYLLIVIGLIFGFGLLAPVGVGAQTALDEICAEDPTNILCPQKDLMDYVKEITDLALVALGALSVIMIIVGGIKYVLSAGDAKRVETAKNTIMYSIVGLVVALLAGVIVHFVIGIFD